MPTIVHHPYLFFLELLFWVIMVRRPLLRRAYPNGITTAQFWTMFLLGGIAAILMLVTGFGTISTGLAILFAVVFVVLLILMELIGLSIEHEPIQEHPIRWGGRKLNGH
jgi:hypothetical protein